MGVWGGKKRTRGIWGPDDAAAPSAEEVFRHEVADVEMCSFASINCIPWIVAHSTAVAAGFGALGREAPAGLAEEHDRAQRCHQRVREGQSVAAGPGALGGDAPAVLAE